MDDQRGRRIVSRSVYGLQVASRAISMGTAWLYCMLAVSAPMLAGCAVVVFLSYPMKWWMRLLCLTYSVWMGHTTFRAYRKMKFHFARAKEIEIGIPRTRSNVGQLPAEESLVRASSEPTLQQQSVLLRAASESDTTPVEQLVRPASGLNTANLSADENLGQTVAEPVEQQQVVSLRPAYQPDTNPAEQVVRQVH